MKNYVLIIIYLLCVGSLLYNNYVQLKQLKNQAEIIRALKTNLSESMQILRECDRQIQERTYHHENRTYFGHTGDSLDFKNNTFKLSRSYLLPQKKDTIILTK